MSITTITITYLVGAVAMTSAYDVACKYLGRENVLTITGRIIVGLGWPILLFILLKRAWQRRQ